MPDGFRVDVLGNVWSSAGWAGPEQDGVQIFAPDGDKIGAIHLPDRTCASVALNVIACL